ncbi:fatty acid-binding protein 2-like [Euwallacea similis]|uniref:fatty acid-binding protein 2-like n=1 Tax=Euwallacea similis TaxID=1736056 RepID=UPI00344BC069
MSLAGKYQIVKNEGFLEYLIAQGLPAERAQEFLNDANNIEISINKDNITITRGSGLAQTLTNNKEISETAPDGTVFKNFATLDGNTLTIESNSSQATWKRIYSLSGSELTVRALSSKSNVADGVRVYKKL